MTWFEAFGWLGSILVVVSLTLSNLRRFRTLNLTGSVIATIYNTAIEIWPFAAMNAAIALINIYWLIRLHRERFVSRTYAALWADVSDDTVQHTLREHAAEIATFYPQFDGSAGDEGRHAFLIATGDVTAGLIVLRRTGPDSAEVELDFVTRAYRDYSPGEFVYRDSHLMPDLGLVRLVVPRGTSGDDKHFRRAGFVPGENGLVLEAPTG
ncbi:hypothetical protein [Ornithinimicrobium cryptoxanthini]|uniref:hypothetical protein n=1 Tax=Ornithinimicrobium cryptoxanthini TaxID=2934161 RepID=UPI002118B925|nr:hypothetical protein [Ornithinimicrobium cryptoxanthini]